MGSFSVLFGNFLRKSGLDRVRGANNSRWRSYEAKSVVWQDKARSEEAAERVCVEGRADDGGRIGTIYCGVRIWRRIRLFERCDCFILARIVNPKLTL